MFNLKFYRPKLGRLCRCIFMQGHNYESTVDLCFIFIPTDNKCSIANISRPRNLGINLYTWNEWDGGNVFYALVSLFFFIFLSSAWKNFGLLPRFLVPPPQGIRLNVVLGVDGWAANSISLLIKSPTDSRILRNVCGGGCCWCLKVILVISLGIGQAVH